MYAPCASTFTVPAPEVQPEHHYLPQETLDFIKTCYPEAGFLGNITLCCKGRYMRRMATVNVARLHDYLSQAHISKARDYYIARNPSSNMQRTSESMSSLLNIVIDIDCHRKKIDPYSNRENLDKIVHALTADWFLDEVIPSPNYVHYTGRGIQLWWTLEPNIASECYRAKYSKVTEFFMACIEKTLSAIPEGRMYQLDRIASANAVGLVRIPGTYNTRSTKKHQTEITCLDTMPHNLHRLYDSIITPDTPKKFYKMGSAQDAAALCQSRLRMLESLRDYRSAPIGNESRDKLSFVYYCTARISCSHEDAYQALIDFNKGFRQPMREMELRNVICTARKKASADIYKFKNQTLIDFLDISPDEQVFIGLTESAGHARSKNAARDEKRRENKVKRDKKIISLHRKGFSYRAIAEALRLDRRTVAKAISACLEAAKTEDEPSEKSKAKPCGDVCNAKPSLGGKDKPCTGETLCKVKLPSKDIRPDKAAFSVQTTVSLRVRSSNANSYAAEKSISNEDYCATSLPRQISSCTQMDAYALHESHKRIRRCARRSLSSPYREKLSGQKRLSKTAHKGGTFLEEHKCNILREPDRSALGDGCDSPCG